MHHFPGRQIKKCTAVLAWHLRHHPSINQVYNILYAHREHAHTHTHTKAHTAGMQKYADWMSCHLLSNILLRDKLRETGWALKKWTWHLTNPVLKSGGAESRHGVQNPFCPSFGRHCMFVGCQIKYLWILGDRMAEVRCAGGCKCWRNSKSWQMEKLYL